MVAHMGFIHRLSGKSLNHVVQLNKHNSFHLNVHTTRVLSTDVKVRTTLYGILNSTT